MKWIMPVLAIMAIIAVCAYTPTARAEATNGSEVPQCIYFFYSRNCHTCIEANNYLKTIESKYPLLNVTRFEIQNKTNYDLLIEFYRFHNITTYRWPVVFIGNEFLVGNEEIQARLEPLLANKTGWVCPSPNSSVPPYPEPEAPKPPLPIIAGMAFADSMNPCAISVLLLLVVAVGASTSGIWKTGGAYILGNFVAYLLIGFGLFSVLQQFEMPLYINKVIGMAAIVIGAYSLFSKIPAQSRPVIKRLINQSTSAPLAFLAGAAISAIELPCTGGPYFLALTLMSQYRLGQLETIGYLLFYNMIFVMPLVIITLLYGAAIAPKIPKKQIRIVSAVLMILVGIALLLL